MSTNKDRMFITNDGQNVFFTFALVSSLFLLWGFCNGMIDVMDKHFQEELHLTLSQSAWVQFAHSLGYFLMAMPAGWLATRLGYKGGIIVGLLMVSLGGFWFIPSTSIAQFWAFLLGVCVIAAGLTFLETVANPYTTVLGDPRYAAARINLAQSCNGIGWILGPIAGSVFFYGKDAAGKSTGAETLWIPYAAVAVVVLLLAVVFYFARVPDIRTEDDYHLDDRNEGVAESTRAERQVPRVLAFILLWLNSIVLIGVFGMIFWLALNALGFGELLVPIASKIPHPSSLVITADNSLVIVLFCVGCLATVALGFVLIPTTAKLSHHNIWSHPHFSGSTLVQFLYVAAQAGIFSFLINYVTTEPPACPEFLNISLFSNWLERRADGLLYISNQGGSILVSVGFVFFLTGRFSGAALLRKYSAHKVLGLYGLLNVFVTFLVFCKLGWFSFMCVFVSYFFMSIMFPTIFALGIFGLGERTKKASAFIVMAIMGGAVLPKIMGAVGDHYDMSRAFIVPMVCFIPIALYGYLWPKLSNADSMQGLKTSGGH